jgi:uncharacterized protein YndB with AHSA1/START domain
MLVMLMPALWFLGGEPAEHRGYVAIRSTPERVFEYLVDPKRMVEWVGGLKEVRLPGRSRIEAGARCVQVMEEGGRRVEVEAEVLAVDPGRRLDMRLRSEILEATNGFRLTAEEGETRVQQLLRASYKGWYRSLSPILRRTLQTRLEADLANLKAIVEKAR